MLMKNFTVRQLFDIKKKDFSLSTESNLSILDKSITTHIVNRPQLALSGYFQSFRAERIQLLGETELVYLNTLSEDVLYERLYELMQINIPCIIVSKGLSVPSKMIYLAEEFKIPIIFSNLSTDKLYWNLNKYLRGIFRQTLTMHATLVQVHGVGIILTGKSGIGKSECALELIERGHIIVSDDVIYVKSDDEFLYGSSPKNYECYMEVRGVGVIDVEQTFGIQSVKKEIKIDLQVEMMSWHENMDYERLGIGNEKTEMLNVRIPMINIPVSPGKNIAIIIEVIAKNYILKNSGFDAAKNRSQRLAEEIHNKISRKEV